MVNRHMAATDPRQRRRKQDERIFQLLFVLSFPVFLTVVFAARMLPSTWWSGAAANGKHGSMLAEAEAAARSTIAIALAD